MIPASAMKASSKEPKICVVSVKKPSGETNRLIGSSFITDRSTRPVPASRPGPIIGRSTAKNRRSRPAPRMRAESCSLSGTLRTATSVTPMASEPKRTM